MKRNRKGSMEGLRNFAGVRNHSALDVGQLSEGIRPFQVRRPQFKEECAEEAIREGPEELTLRAEEAESQKSCNNVDHIAEDRCGPPLVDADWHVFCQANYKGIEGSEW